MVTSFHNTYKIDEPKLAKYRERYDKFVKYVQPLDHSLDTNDLAEDMYSGLFFENNSKGTTENSK